MVLDVDTIFPTAKEGADEFFVQEAEEALRPRIVVKLVDEDTPVSDTSLIEDGELFMSVSADQTYEFEVFFADKYVGGCGGDPDLKYTFSGPTGSSGKFWGILLGGGIETTMTPLPFGTIINAGSSSNYSWSGSKGWIKTGNTAGFLRFKFGAVTSETCVARIEAGAWLKVTRQ